MKKMLIGLAGLAALTALLPTSVRADAATAPTQCGIGLAGPSRATHSPGRAELTVPLCSTLAVCVTLQFVQPTPSATPIPTPTSGGPRRAVHPALPECPTHDPACEFTFQVQVNPTGPSRATHQAPRGVAVQIVDIPKACLDVLNAALAPVPTPTPTPVVIPSTGSDSAPLTLIGAALIGAGGLLMIGQRRLARR